MFGKKFYYDDPEGDGLSPKTSHPRFVKLAIAEFYYDCTDDFSPFGNDDGADILYELEDWFREHKGKGNIIEWLFDTIDGYGFKYQSRPVASMLDLDSLSRIQSEEPHFIDCMDRCIIAAAFGQIKISGKINSELLGLANITIKRQALLTKKDDPISREYLSRLEIMSRDLRTIDQQKEEPHQRFLFLFCQSLPL